MIKYRSFLSLMISCFLITDLTQEVLAQNIHCGTGQIHRQLLISDSSYRYKYRVLEENIYAQISQPVSRRQPSNQIYTIPVVVNVIHLGEPVGTGSNISDVQIYDAINGVNDRFRNDFGNGSDMYMEFCLAARDSNGNAATGINRVDGSGVPGYASVGLSYRDTIGADEMTIKNLSRWPRSDYYNIWVVHNIAGNINAFAFFPTQFEGDGTVIEYSSVTYSNHTLAHELGHAFNLLHTFEGDNWNNCPANNDCWRDGDRICDTPPHRSGDCGSANPCSGSGVWDNSRKNYMSSCGASADRFTEDQRDRMRYAVLFETSRASLINSSGCVPVTSDDAAIVEIINPASVLCDKAFSPKVLLKNFGTANLTSVTINYRIDSGVVQSYLWNGLLPRDSTAIVELGIVAVPTYGTYQLICYSSLPNGNTDGYPGNDTACSPVEYYQATNMLPLVEDFENAPYPPSRWIISSEYGPYEHAGTWRDTSLACKGGVYYVQNWGIHNFDGLAVTYDLFIETLDLRTYANAYLTFEVAYKSSYSNRKVNLSVDVSTDCGYSFTNVYYKPDNMLFSSPGNYFSNWAPAGCNDWRKDSIDLSPFVGNKVIIRIRCIVENDSGQNLFIVNIKVDGNRLPGTTQHIPINTGWNMISCYVHPGDSDVSNIIAGISADIEIMKDIYGKAIIPSLGIDLIGNWNMLEGYKVKASDSIVLSITGVQAEPAITPVSLPSGWSMASYLRSSPMNAANALSGVSSNIRVWKDVTGAAFIPLFGINSIGDLLPGQGYKVKMSNAAILYYPANN